MYVIGDTMLETASKIVLVETLFERSFNMIRVADSDIAITAGRVANSISLPASGSGVFEVDPGVPCINVGSSSKLGS